VTQLQKRLCLNLDLKDRYQTVVDKVRSQQNPNYPVRIIAVSKGQSTDKIQQLYSLGQRNFAESYLEELAEKTKSLKNLCPAIRWIFVGGLQSNKIKRIVEISDEIHSLSSHKHIRYAQRYAELFNKKLPVFISVNQDEEQNKKGAKISELSKLATEINSSSNLKLQGIMAIPNKDLLNYPDKLKQQFAHLKDLSQNIGEKKISLGMSQDYESAITAGANEVRIGQAIFGPRQHSTKGKI
jgi:PLP dependent protein